MKNNNKLARNAIRARKAQKKRANEQDKPKKGKRWFSRLFALIGCLLLVSALALPCFAETSTRPTEPPPDYVIPTPEFKNLFYSFYGLSQSNGDALVLLMNSIFFIDLTMPYVYQFDIADIGDRVAVDEPITFNDHNSSSEASVCLYDKRNGNFYYYSGGYWGTEYTTSGTTRIMRVKYYERNDSGDVAVLNIRLQYDYDTLYVVDSSITGTGIDFITGTEGSYSGVPGSFSIGTSATVTNNAVLAYITGMSFVRASVSANYDAFVNGVSAGVDLGFNSGKTQGEEHGYYDGWNFGYDDGVIDGYNSGSREGYEDGYNVGYERGLQDGYSSDAFQAGYDQAVSEIKSGDFGRNLLGKALNGPLNALNDFVLVEFDMGDAAPFRLTLGSIVYIIIGLSFTLWFLKAVRG